MVALAAALLALVSVAVLAAARSPRLAEQLFRFPRGWRGAALRRPTAARVVCALVWFAAWVLALTAVAATTHKPALGLAVGAFVGGIVAAGAAMALTLALHAWEADALGRALSLRGPNNTVAAADLAPPIFVPAFPRIVGAADPQGDWSRTERTMRWVRNGCATLFVAVITLARVATVRGDGPVKTALGIFGLALILTAIGAFGALAFARRMRERGALVGAGSGASITDVCAAHGWVRGSLDERGLRRRWPGLPFFADDKEHRVRDFIHGRLGAYDLDVIDERGTPSGGSSLLMRETRQTLYVLSMPGTKLPQLSVSARHARYLPQQRVNRTLEFEAFNRAHHVACADPALASAVLTPRMMSLLIAELQPGAQLVISGDALAIVVPGRLRLGLLEATVSFLAAAASLMPSYLLREYSTVTTSRG